MVVLVCAGAWDKSGGREGEAKGGEGGERGAGALPTRREAARGGGGAHLEEVGERLDALVAARVAAQVELLDVGHRLERLHEGVQAVGVEAVAAQVDLGDRGVAHALLRDHLDPRALHLAARAVEDGILGIVVLDLLHDLVGGEDLEGGLPPLARQRLLVVRVHVLICITSTRGAVRERGARSQRAAGKARRVGRPWCGAARGAFGARSRGRPTRLAHMSPPAAIWRRPGCRR